MFGSEACEGMKGMEGGWRGVCVCVCEGGDVKESPFPVFSTGFMSRGAR